MAKTLSMRGGFVAASLALCIGAAAAASFEGRWEGVVQIGGTPMPIVLDLAPASAPGVGWQGSATLPGRGIKGAPLKPAPSHGDELRFTLTEAFTIPSEPAPAIVLRSVGEGLAGEFEMSGLSAPLKLQRSGAAQVDRPPANTPLSEALAGTWRGSYELGGYSRQVTLNLARDAAAMTIVGKRTTQLVFDRVIQGARFLTLASSEYGIAVEGRWLDGVIDGLFLQGSFEAKLILKRDATGSAR